MKDFFLWSEVRGRVGEAWVGGGRNGRGGGRTGGGRKTGGGGPLTGDWTDDCGDMNLVS